MAVSGRRTAANRHVRRVSERSPLVRAANRAAKECPLFICGRPSGCKRFCGVLERGRCCHLSGLLMQRDGCWPVWE